MTRPVLAIACKANELVETLAESLRVVVHAQLDELIAAYQEPIPYAVTEAGMRERLADDEESRFSAELDMREEP